MAVTATVGKFVLKHFVLPLAKEIVIKVIFIALRWVNNESKFLMKRWWTKRSENQAMRARILENEADSEKDPVERAKKLAQAQIIREEVEKSEQEIEHLTGLIDEALDSVSEEISSSVSKIEAKKDEGGEFIEFGDGKVYLEKNEKNGGSGEPK